MNKSKIILIISLVIFAGALATFFIMTKNSGNQAESEPTILVPDVSIQESPQDNLAQELSDVEQLLSPWGFDFPQTQPMVAPSFTTQNLSGETLSLEDYQGEFLILNFWATWCPPCREEIPSMEAMLQEISDLPVAFLSISSGETEQQVAKFVADNQVTLPVALDSDGRISTSYFIESIPTTYLIDSEGNFIARKVGAMDWSDPDWLESLNQMINY